MSDQAASGGQGHDKGQSVTPSKKKEKKQKGKKGDNPSDGGQQSGQAEKGEAKSPRGQQSEQAEKGGAVSPRGQTGGKTTTPDKKEKKKGPQNVQSDVNPENPNKKEKQKSPQSDGSQGDASKKEKQNAPPKAQNDSDPNKPQKSKAELKAERRALQEKQRALKEQKKQEGAGTSGPSKDASAASVAKAEPKRVPDHIMADDAEAQKKMAKKLEKQKIPQRTKVQRQVKLFQHLHQYEREVSLTQSLSFKGSSIHPVIVRLGIQYAEGVICGSNARCLALLAAFKHVIEDYTTPPQKELSRDLEARIKPYISFLNQCRLMSVSMGNAIKYLKYNISHGTRDLPETEAKKKLIECIDDFVRLKLEYPCKAICDLTVKENKKIVENDVIVVYACSSLVLKVLLTAHKQKINFRVIVIDGRPRMEGKEMLRRLVRAGIKCSYMLINAVSYAMQEATKVFLGAHALLANGCVMSRVGSSQLALVAKSFNVSVLVCCETYKFCERGQTDSFVLNELGDPDDLVSIGNKTPYLTDWRDYSSVTLLNLVYDVTPPEFISVVITELGLIPCTSVPVVLRMKHAETAE